MSWAAVAGAGIGLAGSLLGGSDEPSGQTQATQTSSNEPWSGIQPYLRQLYSQANQWSQQAPYFQGPFITPQSQYSRQAIEGLASQAQDPTSLVSGAQRQLGDTIGGKYLDVGSNPYLQGAVQQALGQVQSNVSGRFSNENYGGSANQEWLGKQLAGTALPIYAQQYQNER
jgi:hypothetical protein